MNTYRKYQRYSSGGFVEKKLGVGLALKRILACRQAARFLGSTSCTPMAHASQLAQRHNRHRDISFVSKAKFSDTSAQNATNMA
jgi:hypothetical protein